MKILFDRKANGPDTGARRPLPLRIADFARQNEVWEIRGHMGAVAGREIDIGRLLLAINCTVDKSSPVPRHHDSSSLHD
jgi:hypothetical protein